jgi:hypothetical protein
VNLQEKNDVFQVEAGKSFHLSRYRKFIEKIMKRGINDLWLNSFLTILCVMTKYSDQGSGCQDHSLYVLSMS